MLTIGELQFVQQADGSVFVYYEGLFLLDVMTRTEKSFEMDCIDYWCEGLCPDSFEYYGAERID